MNSVPNHPTSIPPSIQRLRRRPTSNLVLYAFCLAMLFVFVPASLYAADTTCTDVAGLPDEILRTDYCVYYDDADTSDTQATTVADHVEDYWDRYTTDFGFKDPKFTTSLEVRILDNNSCNGGTSSSSNNYTMNNGCFVIAEWAQKVAGHELFHRVQYSYDGVEAKWFKEGTARAMEDLVFTNIDHWATALSATSSFNTQVNGYLNNTNVDITTDAQKYNSALWWKYFSEQFGSVVAEPERGYDAFLELWKSAETKDDIAALNQALTNLGAGMNFDAAFRLFAGANWLKDLTNQPDTWANYIDEDEAQNPAAYGPIAATNGGTINTSTSTTFNNQSLSRYGARYYRAQPSSTDCPVVSVTFHTDSGPAFYHVVAQNGNNIEDHAMTTATDYSRAFFNTGLTRVVAIAGATNNSAQADITMECVDPVLDIKLPNSGAVANVGPFNGPGKFLAQVQVTNGSPTGPVVSGLAVSDFKARVDGNVALILSGGFIQEQYWLLIQAPTRPANGTYDLVIDLEESGTNTVIDSDTEIDSILYSSDSVDHLLVVDRSGSMSSDGKIEAARQAAKFYVDITRDGDGLAVIPYDTDVEPAPFDLTEVTTVPNVRNDAKSFINGPKLNPTGLTSIGDGMDEAADQRNATPTGNPACSYVLLSDGMENSAQFWADVQAKVVATGCPVTAIALGAASDETLMEAIATATGGAFFFNDVFTSESVAAAGADAINTETQTVLALGNAYEYAQGDNEGRQRMLAEMDSVAFSQVISHEVMIDESVTEAVFSLDWDEPEIIIDLKAAAADQGERLRLVLVDPDGNLYEDAKIPYTFADAFSGHVGWRIPNPTAGKWELRVSNLFDGPTIPYQVFVSGESNLSIDLLLPALYSNRAFSTGQRVPIYAFISGDTTLGGLSPSALVKGPGDVLPMRVQLYDDGMHGDGDADDGFYGGSYTRVNRAQKVQPVAEDGQESPEAKDEGSYQVQMLVQGMYNGLPFQREALGGFAVYAGADENNNGLPDPYEEENDVDAGSDDNDLDGLTTDQEFQLGTDPNKSDTDGGGENDGSEFDSEPSKDPFDPTDDDIAAPDYIHATAGISMTTVTYDVKDEYDNRLNLWRRDPVTGNWVLIETELPPTGIYSDTDVMNGQSYAYRYMAFDADNDRSAVIGTTMITPSEDPYPPEAEMLINGGAATTTDLNVILSFEPTGEVENAEEPNQFDDITEMRLSNDPILLLGESYQPFDQDVPWTLSPTDPGNYAQVYAMFKDDFGNESLITPAAIQVVSDPEPPLDEFIYLPAIKKQ